jgi:GPN-loop GTPase
MVAGKSTFCAALIQHLRNNKRSVFYINLDPAAEDFVYEPDVDIKDLVSLEDVMEELGYGPNGGLMHCFEFLQENMDFLTDALEDVSEEYLIIIDMPGQIELFTHMPFIPQLVKELGSGSLNIRLCATYLLESTFVEDRAKFFSGTLSAMSAMLMLEIPHVNILSKIDLTKGKHARRELRRFLNPDAELLDDEPVPRTRIQFEPTDDAMVTPETADDVINRNADDPLATDSLMGGVSFARLNKAVAKLIDDFSMVQYLQLDANDEDSVGAILSYIDDAIQYHEAQEPREPRDELEEMEYNFGEG